MKRSQFTRYLTRSGRESLETDYVLIGVLSLSGLAITLLLGIPMYFLGWTKYAIFNGMVGLFCGIIFLINYREYFKTAAIALSVSFPVIILYYTYIFGYLGSENYYFIGGFLGIYFLRTYPKIGIGVWLIYIFAYVGSEYLLWKHHGLYDIDVQRFILHNINSIFAFAIVTLVAYLAYRRLESRQQEVETLSRNREYVLNALSHDLRGPVRNLGVILDRNFSDHMTSQEISQFLQNVSQRFASVEMSMDNTLVWARQQMNGIQVQGEEVDLVEIAGEVVRFLDYLTDYRKVEIDLDVPQRAIVYTDRQLLAIIMRNILSNAIKYSDRKSGKVKLRIDSRDQNVILEIEDNGRGMSEEIKQQLESGDWRAGESQNSNSHGLGLHIARIFTDMIGGRLKIFTELDKGTCVKLLLPVGTLKKAY